MIYKLDQIFVIVPNTPCRLVDFHTAVRELFCKLTIGKAELVRLPWDNVIFRLPWDDVIFNPSVNIAGLDDDLVCFHAPYSALMVHFHALALMSPY